MIRQLLCIMAALGLVLSATTATAGIFDAENSFLGFKLGTIPRIDIPAGSAGVTLSDDGFGGHIINEEASLFETTNFWINSAAFTGFPDLTGLKITVHSGSGQFADGFSTPNSVGPGNIGGFGGLETVTGAAVLIAQGQEVNIPLDVLGTGGTTTIASVLQNNITLQGEPYGTLPVQITNISSNIVFSNAKGTTGIAFTLNLTTADLITAVELTQAGAFLTQNVATITGTNTLASASQPGMVTVVSPFRVNTGTLAGKIPGAVYKKFVFVPEPGTMLLLVSGAVGLAVIGRKRMKK